MTGKTWRRLAIGMLLVGAGCNDPMAPQLSGSWGGAEAILEFNAFGGKVYFACSGGVFGPGWTLDRRAQWKAVGFYYTEGGPLPPEGHPQHPATYEGQLQGDDLWFTVKVPELETTLGPFKVTRGAPGTGVMCA